MIRQFIERAFRAMWYAIDYLDAMPTYKIVAVIIGFGIMAYAIAVLVNRFFRKGN